MQVFPFHKAGENVSVICFPLFAYTRSWIILYVCDYFWCCAVYDLSYICTWKCAGRLWNIASPFNYKLQCVVKMSKYRKCANFVRLCPEGNMHEASRQFNDAPMGHQAVICLKALSFRKDVDVHEEALIALSADKLYDLSCLVKQASLYPRLPWATCRLA